MFKRNMMLDLETFCLIYFPSSCLQFEKTSSCYRPIDISISDFLKGFEINRVYLSKTRLQFYLSSETVQLYLSNNWDTITINAYAWNIPYLQTKRIRRKSFPFLQKPFPKSFLTHFSFTRLHLIVNKQFVISMKRLESLQMLCKYQLSSDIKKNSKLKIFRKKIGRAHV